MIIPANVDFSKYIDFIGQQESQEIHGAGYWTESVLDRLSNGIRLEGDKLPWAKSHDKVRLRTGELSVWAGYNGHKKSMMLGWVMLNLAHSRRVAIASLELSPVETINRMITQAAGLSEGETVSRGFAERFMQWADPNIAIYDQLDMVPAERILGFVHYCAKELKCQHIVIDSLTKCGIAKDDGVAEKKFTDRLQWAAKTLGCHIHLVCHMRKPEQGREQKIPSKYDIRGAGEITDLADNVFIVWMNKKKQEVLEKQKVGVPITTADSKELDKPDQILVVDKQRHGGWEGSWGFWTHASQQFLPNASMPPINYNFTREAVAA